MRDKGEIGERVTEGWRKRERERETARETEREKKRVNNYERWKGENR